MPRRKLGLRKYHHKNGNGCTNCKRRRVKCDTQLPACANCVRRNERCEYLHVASLSPPLVERTSKDTQIGHVGSSPSSLSSEGGLLQIRLKKASDFQVSHVGPTLGSLQTPLTFPNPLQESISRIFNLSWFPRNEVGLWIPVLEKSAARYPYVQHALLSLSALAEELDAYFSLDLATEPRSIKLPVAAYQHHIIASSLFRQVPPIVDKENWLAVMCFGVSTIVFHFAVQQFRNVFEDTNEFSVLETFQILRSSMKLSRELFPYLSTSRFWPFIVQQSRQPVKPLDPRIRGALHNLGLVVTQAIADGDTNAEANRQAFWNLREWVFECEGQPRIWRHLLSWPADVPPTYLNLLSQGNDIALLLLIHWCAIMYLSPRRWFITIWAKRTATVAMDLLKIDWNELLAWPLTVFAKSAQAMPENTGLDPLLNPLLIGNGVGQLLDKQGAWNASP